MHLGQLWASLKRKSIFFMVILIKRKLSSSFPLPPNEEAECSVWAMLPYLHLLESPLSTLCSRFESQQRNGWNAEIWWSESSSVGDHWWFFCYSRMVRVPILVQTRQIWSINISTASIKKPTTYYLVMCSEVSAHVAVRWKLSWKAEI